MNCGDVEGLFGIAQRCMFLKVRSHSSIAYSNFNLTAELLSPQNPIFSDVPSPFGPFNDDHSIWRLLRALLYPQAFMGAMGLYQKEQMLILPRLMFRKEEATKG